MQSESQQSGKLSISLQPDLLEFVHHYQIEHQLPSRSQVFADALGLLREQELRRAYRQASLEWDSSQDSVLWERTIRDGL